MPQKFSAKPSTDIELVERIKADTQVERLFEAAGLDMHSYIRIDPASTLKTVQKANPAHEKAYAELMQAQQKAPLSEAANQLFDNWFLAKLYNEMAEAKGIAAATPKHPPASAHQSPAEIARRKEDYYTIIRDSKMEGAKIPADLKPAFIVVLEEKLQANVPAYLAEKRLKAAGFVFDGDRENILSYLMHPGANTQILNDLVDLKAANVLEKINDKEALAQVPVELQPAFMRVTQEKMKQSIAYEQMLQLFAPMVTEEGLGKLPTQHFPSANTQAAARPVKPRR